MSPDGQKFNKKQEKDAEGSRRKKKAQVVEELIEKVEQKIGQGDVKATLGDYIRLVQLQKELEEDEPKEIEVRWIDPEQIGPDKET
jgi:hypothetical protein